MTTLEGAFRTLRYQIREVPAMIHHSSADPELSQDTAVRPGRQGVSVA